jgi:predicted nucleic acid-binding protein
MSAIAVCSDANVAYQWFHAEDEDPAEVDASRTLARLSAVGTISIAVLDLTRYELANALLRGHLKASAEEVAAVLDALPDICPVIDPTDDDLREAIRLAEDHRLTVYDATYAAVARSRGAELATLDKALLKAGLGRRPSEIVEMVRLGAEYAGAWDETDSSEETDAWDRTSTDGLDD